MLRILLVSAFLVGCVAPTSSVMLTNKKGEVKECRILVATQFRIQTDSCVLGYQHFGYQVAYVEPYQRIME